MIACSQPAFLPLVFHFVTTLNHRGNKIAYCGCHIHRRMNRQDWQNDRETELIESKNPVTLDQDASGEGLQDNMYKETGIQDQHLHIPCTIPH